MSLKKGRHCFETNPAKYIKPSLQQVLSRNVSNRRLKSRRTLFREISSHHINVDDTAEKKNQFSFAMHEPTQWIRIQEIQKVLWMQEYRGSCISERRILRTTLFKHYKCLGTCFSLIVQSAHSCAPNCCCFQIDCFNQRNRRFLASDEDSLYSEKHPRVIREIRAMDLAYASWSHYWTD